MVLRSAVWLCCGRRFVLRCDVCCSRKSTRVCLARRCPCTDFDYRSWRFRNPKRLGCDRFNCCICTCRFRWLRFALHLVATISEPNHHAQHVDLVSHYRFSRGRVGCVYGYHCQRLQPTGSLPDEGIGNHSKSCLCEKRSLSELKIKNFHFYSKKRRIFSSNFYLF